MSPVPTWGSHQQHRRGGSLLLQTRPGGALVVSLPKLLCTPFSPTFPLRWLCLAALPGTAP